MKEYSNRLDKIFPLREAAFYPGRDCCDLLFFLQPRSGETFRFWLLTEAKAPKATLDDHTFQIEADEGSGRRWIDLGTTDGPVVDEYGKGLLTFHGISPKEAANSYFLVTGQPEKRLAGSIRNAEKTLWGINREEVGRTCISPSTVEAGTATEFHLIYACSGEGLPKGSYLALSLPKGFSPPQTNSSEKEGFLSVLRSDRPVEPLSINSPGEYSVIVDVIFFLPEGLGPSEEIAFSYSTEQMHAYDVIMWETELRYWFSPLTPLTVSISVNGGKHFVELLKANAHSLRVIPGKPEWLHLILPGRRKSGEPISLTGVMTDKFKNIPNGNVHLDVKLVVENDSGETLGEIDDLDGRFISSFRFEVPLSELEPGVYRVKALDRLSGDALALSNPLEIVDSASPKANVYWGQIHSHSEMSDGVGGFKEMLVHARDVGCLDFAAPGDHAEYVTDNQWKWMRDVVNHLNDPGEHVTLLGYEWAAAEGHRNIYTSEDDLYLFRGAEDAKFKTVCDHFEDNPNVIAGPHRSHTGDFWSSHNPKVLRFLEVYAVEGFCEKIADDLLNEGAEIGFVGGGDCHIGRCEFSPTLKGMQGKTSKALCNRHSGYRRTHYKCGVTGAFASKLDRQSIIKAHRDRKTYATSGARILIDLSVAGAGMGEIVEHAGPVAIKAVIHACDVIDKVEIKRNGKIVHAFSGGSMDMTIEWEDTDIDEASAWYYLIVSQRDGEGAWTSPAWVRRG